jgi:RRG7 (Required for Respiratory Growth 7) protein
VRVAYECTTFPTPLTLTRYPDPLDATVETMMDSTIANRRRLRVIAQCKAEKRKMGPAYLRELEGVIYRYTAASAPHPSESESLRIPQAITSNNDTNPTPKVAAAAAAKEPPPIALLVSESAFTRNCLLAAHASTLPFLLVHLPRNSSTGGDGDGDGGTGGAGIGSGSSSSSAIGAVFGNPALVSSKGVLGGELEIRWERGGSSIPSSSGVLGSAGRPRLWWQGQPLPSWTPDAGAVEVDGDGVLLNQR